MRVYPTILIENPTTDQTKRKQPTLTSTYSIEHGAVKVVAVNDPFIEPTYAVCHPVSPLANSDPTVNALAHPDNSTNCSLPARRTC